MTWGRGVTPLRLVLAVIGPSAGIALWYWLDHVVGNPELGLFVGAAVIFVAARAGVVVSDGGSLRRHGAFALLMVAGPGAGYWTLVALRVPALVSLAITLLGAGLIHGRIARAVIPIRAGEE